MFFDHMGPHCFEPGKGLDVLPHPHIGLATVTYLFEGSILHRDSIGSVQEITPGAVNLMVAGKGIAHSERTPEGPRSKGHRVHGLQLWHALPEKDEECEPAFLHYAADEIPRTEINGTGIRVLIGEAHGEESPVKTFTDTVYVEYTMSAGSEISLRSIEGEEQAIYAVDAAVSVDGTLLQPGRFALLGSTPQYVNASSETRVILIGGKPLGRRYMWWNYVSSKTERIEQAKADWKAGKFGPVKDDTEEFFPLPQSDSYSRMTDY